MSGQRTRGRFALIGCGAAKAQETVEARELYTSSYFPVKRQHAEAAVQWAGTAASRVNSWGILLAEQAVIMPRLGVLPCDRQSTIFWASRLRMSRCPK
jgi:hypothetical protein